MGWENSPLTISGVRVGPGETREIYLKVSESFMAAPIQIPITVIRGQRTGPTVFVIAALHGNEINGVDIVRRLIFDVDHEKLSGTLIAVPVGNIPGFLTQSRYLPYHRDLNRFFPGRPNGNNAERMAHKIFKEIVLKCDFGVDLHTAAHGRLNLPHIRADMQHPRVRHFARSFGATVVVDQPGVKGSLRREATNAGVPTILFEAGEVGKFSTKISLAGLRGVLNLLAENGMYPQKERPKSALKVIIKRSEWLRAEKGGILQLQARPGDFKYEGDLLGRILNPFGKTVTKIRSPDTGIILGVTTEPLTIPGTGVVHLALVKKTLPLLERSLVQKTGKKGKRLPNLKGVFL